SFSRDWSSDVCSSDLVAVGDVAARRGRWVSAGQLSEEGSLGGPCLTPARGGDTAVQILFNLTEAAAGVTYSVLSTDLPTFFVDKIGRASCRERAEIAE